MFSKPSKVKRGASSRWSFRQSNRDFIYKSLSDFLRIILSLLHSEADFDEMIPLIEKELEEVKNKKKQNKKPKNEEANNEEMENW